MPTTTPKRPEKVRTTLMLPGPLVKQAKHLAVDVERDLQDIVADALAEYLMRQKKGATS